MPTPAKSLTSLDLPGGWHVVRLIPKGSGTGGNFSESYEVVGTEGRRAFLKALDFNLAARDHNPVAALNRLTSKYEFETAVLERCKDLNLRNICTPIACGQADAGAVHGDYRRVPYIIFEFAQGNIRRLCSTTFDAVLILRTIHSVAVGLNQLHTNQIAHQDVKPSNVLHFTDSKFQIADFGEAVDELTPSPNDSVIQPGDPSYWPPEMVYQYLAGGDFSRRRLVDLYLLGSLFFFFFSNTSANQSLMQMLQSQGMPTNRLSGLLQGDMPFYERAFSDSLDNLGNDIRSKVPELEQEIIHLVRELCYPNPEIRGDRHRRAPTRYSLHRYVSRINMLVKRAEILIR
jgi:serine/threonine protein kinase